MFCTVYCMYVCMYSMFRNLNRCYYMISVSCLVFPRTVSEWSEPDTEVPDRISRTRSGWASPPYESQRSVAARGPQAQERWTYRTHRRRLFKITAYISFMSAYLWKVREELLMLRYFASRCVCMRCYVCMYVCMYVCVHVCMCVCTCACMNVYMYVCMHVNIYGA